MQAKEIKFLPSLNYGSVEGLDQLVDSLLGDVFRQGNCIKRIANVGLETRSSQMLLHDAPKKNTYQTDLEEMDDLYHARNEIMRFVFHAMQV